MHVKRVIADSSAHVLAFQKEHSRTMRTTARVRRRTFRLLKAHRDHRHYEFATVSNRRARNSNLYAPEIHGGGVAQRREIAVTPPAK